MIYCATGHRPDKLGGYNYQAESKLSRFAVQVLQNVRPKPEVIYSGMALGWDQAICYACNKVQIPYVSVLPYNKFGSSWPQESQDRLSELLRLAKERVYVHDTDEYRVWYMQDRNEWMVNNAEVVLALWNGSDGGTKNCIKYAEKVNKPVVNFWDKWLNFELK